MLTVYQSLLQKDPDSTICRVGFDGSAEDFLNPPAYNVYVDESGVFSVPLPISLCLSRFIFRKDGIKL